VGEDPDRGRLAQRGAGEAPEPELPPAVRRKPRRGGFIAAAPPWFQEIIRGFVVPNAELFAQLSRLGELLLGLALILGLLTNPAAVGSVLLSLALLFSAGGPRLGTGLGAPEFLNINLLVALVSLVILLSPAAKAFSLGNSLARGRPRLALLLTNRRSGRTSTRDRGA
jgi:thiosulfate dehydrogenase [quinone] large subunit